MAESFFKHYIFCVAGAVTRCAADTIFKKGLKKPLKSYWDYKEKPDKEFLDAVLGCFIIGALAAAIMPVV